MATKVTKRNIIEAAGMYFGGFILGICVGFTFTMIGIMLTL